MPSEAKSDRAPQGDVKALVKKLRASLVDHYRHLHAHPELSWQEKRTADYIRGTLSGLGLEPQACATTGWIVDLPGVGDQGVRALRSDHDAIATQEHTGLPYASNVDGVMHACGHDAHTAILLAVAEVLQQLPERRRPIRLIFQPAEEAIDSGSGHMISSGVLDGVDEIVALHVWPKLATGQVGLRSGPVASAADCWEVSVHGPGGHGARPFETVDLVAVAARIVRDLIELPRQFDPLRQPVVVSPTMIHGGEAFNVIPQEVRLGGTLRVFDMEVRSMIRERMQSVVHAVALEARAEARLEWKASMPPLVNDPQISARATRCLGEMLGPDHVVELDQPSLGSEDFARYTERVPGILLRLGCTAVGQEAHPLHSSHFHVDEDALETGVLAMCAMAMGEG